MTMKLQVEGPLRLQMQGPMIYFEGLYISDDLFARVVPGQTTEQMTAALFGPAAETYPQPDGTVIWKWIYREHGFDTTMFTLMGDDEETTPTQPQQITFVRFRNGIAIEKWRG